MSCIRNPRSGFTVLEMLVSMALMAMIAATLATTVSQGARVWERSKALPDMDSEILLRMELRDWLRHLKSPRLPLGHRQVFDGTAQTFSFLTTAYLHALPLDAEAEITIAIVETGFDTGDVKLTITGLDRARKPAFTEERVLVEGLTNPRLEYYLPTRRNVPGEWRDYWNARRDAPALVAIRSDGDQTLWPDLVVAVKVPGLVQFRD